MAAECNHLRAGAPARGVRGSLRRDSRECVLEPHQAHRRRPTHRRPPRAPEVRRPAAPSVRAHCRPITKARRAPRGDHLPYVRERGAAEGSPLERRLGGAPRPGGGEGASIQRARARQRGVGVCNCGLSGAGPLRGDCACGCGEGGGGDGAEPRESRLGLRHRPPRGASPLRRARSGGVARRTPRAVLLASHCEHGARIRVGGACGAGAIRRARG